MRRLFMTGCLIMMKNTFVLAILIIGA